MSQANVEMRMLGTVALLCLAGAQVSALSAQQSGGLPCEHWNTSSLPSGFAARCLAAGADPNARNHSGHTPLHLAKGADDVAALLAAGADPNARNDNGFTPLHWADSPDGVAALLAAGADLNARDDLLGFTPLHWAVSNRSVDVVEALLAAGADPNARTWNHSGETPLHWADSADDVAALLAAGANVNARDNYGETPLHEGRADAAAGADVAAALLAAGANVNARDNYGETPLHEATQYQSTGADVVAALLAAGADPNARDNSGQTPLHDLALSAANVPDVDHSSLPWLAEVEEEFMVRDVEVARVLLAAGADPNARWGATAATPLDVLRNAFERLGAGPRRPPLYWLLNDVTAR